MKKILSVFIVMTMIISLFATFTLVSEAAGVYGDFEFEAAGGGANRARITKYNGTSTTVSIPSSFITSSGVFYDVVSLGNNVFNGNTTVKTVTVPASVTSIGSMVFLGCTNLTTVRLYGIQNVPPMTFFECRKLTSVTLKSGSTGIIGSEAFYNCIAMTQFTVPKGTTSISASAFSRCSSMTKITIPHTVKSISNTAFASHNSNLKIYCCAGSYAKTYAVANGISYVTTACTDHLFVRGECTCCGVLLGDVNNDGVVNATDSLLLGRYVSNWNGIVIDLDLADMNRDGEINAKDVLLLGRLIAGWDIWS